MSPLESCCVSSFIIEKLRLTNQRLRQSKICLSLRILTSFTDFKVARHISKDSSQILQELTSLQPPHEKGAPFEREELSRMTFEKIKKYLSHPPMSEAQPLANPSYCTLQLRKTPWEHYAYKKMRKKNKLPCNTKS